MKTKLKEAHFCKMFVTMLPNIFKTWKVQSLERLSFNQRATNWS